MLRKDNADESKRVISTREGAMILENPPNTEDGKPHDEHNKSIGARFATDPLLFFATISRLREKRDRLKLYYAKSAEKRIFDPLDGIVQHH
jgi:hypothetical protein